MTLTYTTGTPSDVRGCCGHKHNTLEAALACMDRDSAACRRHGGYSDRTRIVRSDGAWNTRTGIDIGDDWQGLVYCHGCGDTIASESAHWHTGEPYCSGCESAPSEYPVCPDCGNRNTYAVERDGKEAFKCEQCGAVFVPD